MAQFKILIAGNNDPISSIGIDLLKAEPSFDVVVNMNLKAEDAMIEASRDVDAIIVRSGAKVTAKVIAAAPNLKVVGRAGVGVDNIDIPAASKRGVVVMNTPGGNTVSTAEHAFGLMMSLSRKVPLPSGGLSLNQYGPRPVAWEGIGPEDCAKPRVWVGWRDASTGFFRRINGETGQIEDSVSVPWPGNQWGPYGGATNKEGDFWVVGWQVGPLVRIDVAGDEVDLLVAVRPFAGIDAAIHYIPLIGRGIAAVKNSFLVASFNIKGPIDEPAITPAPLGTLSEWVLGVLRIPKSLIPFTGEEKDKGKLSAGDDLGGAQP